MTKQICPQLKQAGIGVANAGIGMDKNWIKEVCRNCKLDECIYETTHKKEKKHE